MPMIDCRECSKSLSDTAASCPHCGADAATARGAPGISLHAKIVLGFVVLLALGFAFQERLFS